MGQNLTPPVGYTPKNVVGPQAGQAITSKAGLLGYMSINTGVANGVVTLYDGVDATGTKIGTFDATAPRAYALMFKIKTGLFAVIAQAVDVTFGTA